MRLRLLACLLLGLAAARPAHAQDSLTVTFRFLPDLAVAPPASVVRAFLPASFNGWGQPYVNGSRIQPGHPSEMTFVPALGEYRYTQRLRVGTSHQYKVQYHTNGSGPTGFHWIADPLNPATIGQDNNSLVVVADPMLFQLAREENAQGAVEAVSAGLFSTQPITGLTFEVNGVARDGLPHYDAATGLFRYVLAQPVPRGSQLKLTATTAGGKTVAAEVGRIPPLVTDAKRPPGLRDGITYDPLNARRVIFSLFAPYHDYVYLLGHFNDWQVDDAYLMKRDVVNADSVYFWLEVDGLSPGREYAFQYLVDGLIRVADPYSEKVLDPFHDAAIPYRPGSEEMYYPTGKTTEIVGVIEPPDIELPSVSPCPPETYKRPKPQDLVIYELLLRDFQDAHTFGALVDTLDYLQRLGVTAIELMPVAEFDGNLSWGYNPAFHFAVDKYYGSPRALRNLVGEAHCRGMAVILDVVYNHATGQSPLVRLWNASPTGSPAAPPTARNPYANVSARHPFNVFNDLNHDSPATRYWLDRANRYWLETFGVDGFRYDLSKGFTQCPQGGAGGCPNNQGAWDSYDPSRLYNLKRMADSVWAYDPEALLILEHLAQGREEQELATYRTAEGRPGFLLWRKVMGPFNEATMGYHDGGRSNLSGAYFGPGGQGLSVPNAISILEDHDEQRLMRKNARYGATGPGGYDVKQTATSLDRMKTAGVFFFTVPGPKMIWQFGELGYGAMNDECLPEQDGCPGGRTDVRDDGWAYRFDAQRERLYRNWSALLALRRAYSVFTSPQTQVEMSLGGPAKRLKLSLDTLQVVVVGNFDVAPREVVPAFHQGGTWYDYFGGEAVSVTDPNAPLVLGPGAFRLYTSRFVGYAAPGLSVAREEPASLPGAAALGPVWPSPAQGRAHTTLTLAWPAEASLEVFDVLGRRVAVVARGLQPAGEHAHAFDTRAMAPGLYVLRLTTGGVVRTRSFLVLPSD